MKILYRNLYLEVQLIKIKFRYKHHVSYTQTKELLRVNIK